MPRHLMVRRFTDSGQGHSTLQDNMERTPLAQYGGNVGTDGIKTVKFGTSTNLQRKYFPEMATEMSWESLKLDAFATDNGNDDEDDFDDANGTTDDTNDLSRNGYGRMIMSSSSWGSRDLQARTDAGSNTANSRKEKLVLKFPKIDSLSKSSTFREHHSTKNSNYSPGKRNNENVSEYGVLGVKKNFLRRSESSGYSRLHVSPSKPCVNNSSPRSFTQSGHTPKSCKQHSKYSPGKNVSFSKHIVMRSRSLKLSELGSPSRADYMSPVLENCQLTHKGAETDGMLAPGELRSSSTISYTCNTNTNDLVSGLKCSRSSHREMTPRATQETDFVMASVHQPVSWRFKVLKERPPLGQIYELSENILDLSSPLKHRNNCIEDNKENSPSALDFKKAQSPKCDNQTGKTDPRLRVPATDSLSQNPLDDTPFLGDNLHIPQHRIPDHDPQNSHCTDVDSPQYGFTDDNDDDADADDDDDDDDEHDDDDCSTSTDTGMSDTTERNRELHPAISLLAPLSISPLHDSVHPASMSEEDSHDRTATPVLSEMNNPDEPPDTLIIDVVGDSPLKDVAATSVDSGVYADMSSRAGSSFSKSDASGPADAAALDDSRRRSSLHRPSTGVEDRRPAFITPNHQHPKPIHSSTPVSAAVTPWFQPHPQLNFVHFFQPGPPTYLPVNTPPQYSMQPAQPGFPKYGNGAFPHLLPHPAFLFGFPHHPSAPTPANSRPDRSDLHASPLLNPSLFIDQPLNLTNRRPYQAPEAATQTAHGSVYSPMSSPASVPMASPTAHLFHLASTPAVTYPIPRSSGSHFPGDTRSSPKVPIYSSTQNLPGPSYAFSPLCVPQECPISLSVAARRPKQKPTECENLEGESECKRSRVSKKSKKVSKRLDLTHVAVTNNTAEIKAESTERCQSATRISSDQLIRGVILAMPPGNWRPISCLMKAKEKCGENDRKTSRALKSKENIVDGDHDSAKQRNKPELFGDKEITELTIIFYDCSERGRFCDSNFKFQVPKIPDSSESQTELREALLRLFVSSNLPPVPSALKHSVHALCQYPFMQHIFNLHMQGVNLDNLKFGAYGLAFENIRLVELGEQNFNDILDKMSYLGADDLLHCLVKSEKTGAVCGHVAREIGKIRRHSKNHYPDKKWVCVFCRVQMCDMTDLERHTATHTELKPFECPHCSKKFCQKVTLTQHMNKTHGQQLAKWDAKSSYICRQDGCSYSQGDEEACVRHLKQHHGQSDYIKRKNQNKWPFNVLSADAMKILDDEI